MIRPSKTHQLTVAFDSALRWEEAIDYGAPDTPAEYPVRQVAKEVRDLLAPIDHECKVVLLKFDHSLTSKEVDICALSQGLTPLFPPELWQIAGRYPDLPTKLGVETIGLAALQPFTHQEERMVGTCWWYKTKEGPFIRLAHLTNYRGVWNKDYWFCYLPIKP